MKLIDNFPARLVCRLLDFPRCQLYRPTAEPAEDDSALRAALERLAGQWPTYGYRRLTAMLRREGRPVDVASVPRQLRDALATVSRTVYALMEGEHARLRQLEAARLAQRQALGYRQGLKP